MAQKRERLSRRRSYVEEELHTLDYTVIDVSPNPGFRLREILVRRFPNVHKETSYLSGCTSTPGSITPPL